VNFQQSTEKQLVQAEQERKSHREAFENFIDNDASQQAAQLALLISEFSQVQR